MAIFVLLVMSAFTQAQVSREGKDWHTAAPLAWGTLTEGWQLALFAEKQSFIAGEPVNVMLVGRNGNPTPMLIRVQKSPWYLADFAITRLGDGRAVTERPPKDTADRVRRTGTGVRYSQVAPGSNVAFPVVELARMYDLMPGTYTIQAIFKFPNRNKTAWVPVRSNAITLSIIAR